MILITIKIIVFHLCKKFSNLNLDCVFTEKFLYQISAPTLNYLNVWINFIQFIYNIGHKLCKTLQWKFA